MKIDFRKSFSKDLRKVKNKNLLHQVKEVIETIEKAINLKNFTNTKQLTSGENILGFVQGIIG